MNWAIPSAPAGERANGLKPDSLYSCAASSVPAIPETQAYVADILGLLNGAGDVAAAAASGPDIRLVA